MKNPSPLAPALALMALLAAPAFAGEAAETTAPGPRASMREKTGGSVLRPLPEGAKALVFLDARPGARADGAVAACARRVEAMTRLHVRAEAGSPEGRAPGDVVVALTEGGETGIFPDRMAASVPARATEGESAAALWQAAVALFSLAGPKANDLHGSGIVRAGAAALGIPEVRRAFYVQALREGWAPPPADDFQKALWERHQAQKGK